MAGASTEQVRRAAQELGHFTVADLISRLPVKTYKEKDNVQSLIARLRQRGEVEIVRPGFYRYLGRQDSLLKVARMWRAMRIKECFTFRDVERLTGTSKGYVKSYAYFLKGEGLIEHVTGRGYGQALYRISEDAPLEPPKMQKNRKKK
jgi:hypothetical protein